MSASGGRTFYIISVFEEQKTSPRIGLTTIFYCPVSSSKTKDMKERPKGVFWTPHVHSSYIMCLSRETSTIIGYMLKLFWKTSIVVSSFRRFPWNEQKIEPHYHQDKKQSALEELLLWFFWRAVKQQVSAQLSAERSPSMKLTLPRWGDYPTKKFQQKASTRRV